jgi:hypothetical protein
MIILLVAAAVLTGAPLVAVVLVTIASLREDAGHTLSGRAPNWIDAAARRLLSFDSSGPRRTKRARRRRQADDEEVTPTLTGPRA